MLKNQTDSNYSENVKQPTIEEMDCFGSYCGMGMVS